MRRSMDEQQKRWMASVEHLLAQTGWQDAQIRLLGHTHNTVFELIRGEDERFVLRLHRPQQMSPARLASEQDWLRAVSTGTRLRVPQPMPFGDGAWIASAPFNDETVMALLFRYLPGDSVLPADFTEAHARQVGHFLAEMHQFSARFTPPQSFDRPRLDWEGLFGENSPYHPGAGAAIFTPDQREIFAAVAECVRLAMAELGEDRGEFGMIHADLLCKNLLFRAGEAAAIDFEYCGWGYYLYDLAPLLWQLRSESAFPALRKALWAEYTAIRPLSARHHELLEVFLAARHLASCRWIAANLSHPAVRDKAPQIVEARTAEMRHFLQTGRLERDSEIL